MHKNASSFSEDNYLIHFNAKNVVFRRLVNFAGLLRFCEITASTDKNCGNESENCTTRNYWTFSMYNSKKLTFKI